MNLNELKCTITVRRVRPAILALRILHLLVRMRVLTPEEFIELGAAILATVPRATISGPGIGQTPIRPLISPEDAATMLAGVV